MKKDLSSFFEDSEFKEILNKYKGMVDNHTHTYLDTDDLIDLVNYFIYIDDNEEADKVIEYFLKLHPDNSDAMVFKIRSLLNKGEKDEAYRLLNLMTDTSDREVIFLKAEMLMHEDRLEDADRIYQSLATSENESLAILGSIVECYLDTRNEEYAAKWISHIESLGYNVNNSQKFRDLWCNYCMTFGHFQKAIDTYKISLDANPYSIQDWNGLAECHLALEDLQSALEAIDFSLAIDEHNLMANKLKGFCYMQVQKYDMAIDIFSKMLNLEENIIKKSKLYGMMGQCYTLCGKMEDALKCYMLCLESGKYTDYELADIYNMVAMCHCNLNNLQEAMQYIDMSLAIDPYSHNSIVQKAVIHLQLEEDEQAEQLVQKSLEICAEGERDILLLTIINGYFFMERYEKVLEWCNILIKEYPDYEKRVVVIMGCCYHEMGDDSQAMPYVFQAMHLYKEYIERDPVAKNLLENLISGINEKNKDLGPEEN